MKHLCKILFLFIASILFLQSTGQPPVRQERTNKPLLFSGIKHQIEIPESILNQFLVLNTQDSFHVETGGFQITGLVSEKKISATDSTISLNLRLTNFKNALFNIVSIRNSDNIPMIRGRIIHPKFGDVLILEPEDGKYYLRKLEQRLLLAE